ncbi:kinase-like protein [Microstroma glucosiphilum]|uniref:Kinase-like protein n=1 Tax=Pseudomicrostroma glucosiphilum TaxID=1684307 RepID=A0A316U8N4_9BASI|nr:kinase-like protein [Pseudomicrostroma glucosiphilum]PWN21576.1 kinase-like protein [Pseudomicrostroma glucosiphilum]
MEKSISAPQPSAPEPKTVSGKTLSTRTLHPVFAASYTLGDELGSGGFGFVVGAHRNFDGRPVAVKFIWKNKVPSHGWVRDPTMGVIPLEAFVLRVVDHPCVVKFIDLFDDDEFFYLVMEMHGTPWKTPEAEEESKPVVPEPQQQLIEAAPQKASLAPPQRPAPMERRTSRDLFECIEQHTRFSEDVASWIFAQIVEAVYYLGQLGICHRDIKDENCVIDSDWNVKIIDFGSAVISDPRKPAPYFDRFFGTMTFASSEILQGRQYRAPHAEVWSLGVLLSILLSGECPFSEPAAAVKGRISSRVKNSWSSEAYNLLCGCVQVDPERRATIAQVRDHPWVRRAWERKGLRRPSAPQIF